MVLYFTTECQFAPTRHIDSGQLCCKQVHTVCTPKNDATDRHAQRLNLDLSRWVFNVTPCYRLWQCDHRARVCSAHLMLQKLERKDLVKISEEDYLTQELSRRDRHG